eukprot:SAG31_NODE_1257_length_9081_cov_7.585838_1_plen_47_part_00
MCPMYYNQQQTMLCRPHLPPSEGGSRGCDLTRLHIGFAMAIMVVRT